MIDIDFAGRRVTLARAAVMGIVNVTPDSFSDGGKFFEAVHAIEHGLALAEAGADILDVGGESTRPGASAVSTSEQLDRVLPVIESLMAQTRLPVSIDTSDPEVMRRCVAAGAGLINDVRALQGPGALDAALECQVPVCLMHMLGEPRTMQVDPVYQDVVSEVGEFLVTRADALVAQGFPAKNIILDPGFGFGKTIKHNLTLLAQLERLAVHGFPVLAGLSRKSMIPRLLGYHTDERVPASLALALQAVNHGASILRVHDVRETREALTLWMAVAENQPIE